MIRSQRENAAKKANGHEYKSRIIPLRVLSSISNQLCFHQIRHLGPKVRILGCLPGDAGSSPAGVAKQMDMVLSSSWSGPQAFYLITRVRIPQASPSLWPQILKTYQPDSAKLENTSLPAFTCIEMNGWECSVHDNECSIPRTDLP